MNEKPTSPTGSGNSEEPQWKEQLFARLLSNEQIRSAIQLGKFNHTLEHIIRLSFDIDASKRVKVDAKNLRIGLMHLASDQASTDLKSWALVVIAHALMKSGGGHRLDVKQLRPGKSVPQSADQLAELVELVPIAKSVQRAKALKLRAPNKVAANEHGCSLAKVKRANALFKKYKNLSKQAV